MQALMAQAGYWSGYYQGKRPKKISEIVKSILSKRAAKEPKKSETTEEDINQFQQRELRRMATHNKWEVK